MGLLSEMNAWFWPIKKWKITSKLQRKDELFGPVTCRID